MKKYLHIMLIFILILVFVLNSFVHAFAIVPAIPVLLTNPYFIGTVLTVLAGSGIAVSQMDSSQQQSIVKSLLNSCADGVLGDFYDVATNVAELGLSVDYKFNLTENIVNAIQNWLSGVKAEDGGSVSVGNGVFIDGVDYSYLPLIDYEAFVADSSNCGLISLSSLAEYGTFYPADNGVSAHYIVNLPFFNVGSNSSVSAVYIYTNKDKPKDDGQFINILQDGSINWVSNPRPVSLGLSIVDGSIVILYKTLSSSSFYFLTSSSHTVGTSIPFDSTWSPDSVDEEKKLVPGAPVTMPKGLVNSDGVIDSDVLGGMTSEGVRSGTVDTPTEQTWLESILSALDGLLDGVLEGIKSLFIPEGFSWDFFLDELGSVVSPPQAIDLKSYVQNIEIPDVKVNMKGHELTIVDNSMLRDNIVTFRKFIGAFMAILVMIFNYNMFLKLMGYGGFTVTDSGRAGNTLTPTTPINQNLLTYPTNRG